MNLIAPNPTPYDLNFRLFGIDVRVHPIFWLTSAFLGWDITMGRHPSILMLLVWIFCVFISILIHEMGHVVVGNIFRSYGHIVLYSFGGLTIGSSNLSNRWQRIAVSFAGPFAQFLILGMVYAVILGFRHDVLPVESLPPAALQMLGFLYLINLYWPLLNLLPIWPLDGGKISRELFDWAIPRDGIRASLIVSAVVSGGLALLTILQLMGKPVNIPYVSLFAGGGLYMAIFYGLFAFGSIQALQQMPPSRRDRDDDDQLPFERNRPEPWQRESDWWKNR